MTLIDLGALLVFVVYALLGWYSGTLRRVLGLVIVYVATLAAANMGQYGGGILRQYNDSIPLPDARLIAWLFFLVLILLLLEGAATAVHPQLQLAVVALNRGVGVLVGLITAVVLLTGVAYMVTGYANAKTVDPTATQGSVRDQLQRSAVLLPLAKGAGAYILPLLNGALPRDSQSYFTFEGSRH